MSEPRTVVIAPMAAAIELQEKYERVTSAGERKGRGQFFTPPSVAKSMAGLFRAVPRQFRVLDPGAGVGTLTAAICDRVRRLRSPRQLDIHLFETDGTAIPLLREHMNSCVASLRQAGHQMSYTIHERDFILSHPYAGGQGELFNPVPPIEPFDAVIMNPPYFKISKDSEYARVMERVVHGQPNIYALFMALAADMLKPGGQLVAITPRSFCNGLYFREFRRWFFDRMVLTHVHLFESRTEAFKGAKVLQENVITHSERSAKAANGISISTSFGREIPEKLKGRRLDRNRVIDDTAGDMVVRIPVTAQDERILRIVESWPARFRDLGLRVSTGPIVLFRAREFLRPAPNGREILPLLSVHNVRPFQTVWPVPKKNKPAGFQICTASERLLLPSRNYVFLRRFSAKEERRRLTASCWLRKNYAQPRVALENHLNYIYHADRELSEAEAFGLAALFNSALLDQYFRMISGNTQVNATELRTMRLPDFALVRRIGSRVRRLPDVGPGDAEAIVLDELGIGGALKKYLAEYNQ